MIDMATRLVVTAPLVIVQDRTGDQPGPDMYLYQGATLPDFMSKEQLKNIEGMYAPADAANPVAKTVDDAGNKIPSKSATKGEWEDYARSNGAEDSDLEGLTKDDLIAKYGN